MAKKEEKCRLVLCEDPKTGEYFVKPDGHCPPGFLEKVMSSVHNHGLSFPPARDFEFLKDDKDKKKSK